MATAGKPEVPDSNELVKVFDSEQESEVMVVRGLLQSAGIDCTTYNVDHPQDLFPVGGVEILVPSDQAQEARRLIEDYRTAGAAAADEAEAESEATGSTPEPEA